MKKIAFLVFLFVAQVCSSQINEELKEELLKSMKPKDKLRLEVADEFYNKSEYLTALPIYDSLHVKYPKNLYLAYLLGVCDSYEPHHFNESEKLIISAESIKDKLADYDFFLGKAYEDNDKYNLALDQFNLYLKNELSSTVKSEVLHQIQICKNAKMLHDKGAIAKISPLKGKLNTAGSEYCPIISSEEKFMIFAYSGLLSKGGRQSVPNRPSNTGIFYEDVFISFKGDSDQWGEAKPILELITNGHDAPVSISHDGQKLFIFRNQGAGSGDIFMSKLTGSTWSKPEKLKGINSNAWEGHVCLTPDEKVIYFSSDRPGGFGGRDIWFATAMPDGSWGNVTNLGETINTKYDEDAPFVHSDGKTMFFSSTGHNSIGGYDIFRTDMKGGKWDEPFNVGKPVNTIQDDKYYVVSADGERGYYSSEKSDGQGKQDIYLVEPGMFGKPTGLLMVKGQVTFDNQPVAAEIDVVSKLSKKDFSGVFNSNSVNGSYLVNLPSGADYEIIYKYNGVTLKKNVSTALVDTFTVMDIDAELFSKEYTAQNLAKVDSSQIKGDDIAKAGITVADFKAKYGNASLDSLDFKVQIGAYRIQENFRYTALIGLPKVIRKLYNDGITRFTCGSYSKYNEALSVLDIVKAKGVNDAFIIAIYKDKRISLDELIKMELFK